MAFLPPHQRPCVCLCCDWLFLSSAGLWFFSFFYHSTCGLQRCAELCACVVWLGVSWLCLGVSDEAAQKKLHSVCSPGTPLACLLLGRHPAASTRLTALRARLIFFQTTSETDPANLCAPISALSPASHRPVRRAGSLRLAAVVSRRLQTPMCLRVVPNPGTSIWVFFHTAWPRAVSCIFSPRCLPSLLLTPEQSPGRARSVERIN